MNHVLFRSVVLATIGFSSGTALATAPFPDLIGQQLSIPAPPCTICHLNLNGGPKTVVKPFGVTAMTKYGLRDADYAGLPVVLMQMEADGVDSDHDGVGDIAELRAGTDPNDGAAFEEPRYGLYCSVSHVGGASHVGNSSRRESTLFGGVGGPASAVAWFVAAVVGFTRRRRAVRFATRRA